jgi:sec-independent protein translocase protein TatB
MFEVGFTELLLISVLALIVLGPERLPKVAAQLGRWVGRARAMARQFRDQLEEEAALEPTPRRPKTTPTPDAQPPEVAATSTPESFHPADTQPVNDTAPTVSTDPVYGHDTYSSTHEGAGVEPAPSSSSTDDAPEKAAPVTVHAEPSHERGT